MFSYFESKHSLETLNSYADLEPGLAKLFTNYRGKSTEQIEEILSGLSPESRTIYETRMNARRDLEPIWLYMKALAQQTDIPDGEYEVLYAECKKISDAVGNIGGDGKVHHDR
jgi:hypothetical protein